MIKYISIIRRRFLSGCLTGVILLKCLTTWGHDCGSPQFYRFSPNQINQSILYFIHSDVVFEFQLSNYSVVTNLNPNVATVEVLMISSMSFGFVALPASSSKSSS